jgi:branched-chain amino acid transport system substrate-binding protein
MLNKIFFICVLISINLFTQANVEQRFSEALDLYDQNQFIAALSIFEELSSTANINSRTTAAAIFKGKILIVLDSLNAAEETFTRFIELYPRSIYTDEAKLNLAKIYFLKKEYFTALREFVNLMSGTEDQYYLNEAKAAADYLSSRYVPSSLISELADLNRDAGLNSFLKLIRSRALINEGKTEEGRKILNEIVKEYPDSEERFEAEKIIQKFSEVKNSNLITAVLVPLSGDVLSYESISAANEILEGIKFAFYEYNLDKEEKIGLLIRDTKSNRQTINQIKNEIAPLNEIIAVLGPVYSSEVKETLSEFKDVAIPIISPTATETDLTLMNENFFQANPSFGIRGKIMAQYVYFVENNRRIGILNAIEGYSPLMSSIFKEEFIRLGGEILESQSYQSGSYSLNTQMDRLRFYKDQFEGIYIPLADRADAPMLLSQLVQNEIITNLYGNQDWFSATGFETAPELSNRLTISSDYFIEYNSDEYKSFSRNFHNITNRSVNRNVLYGYDAAKYLLKIIDEGGTDRESVKEKMISGITSTGFHNDIAFDVDRINKYLNIIRYRNGKFELIEKFKAN